MKPGQRILVIRLGALGDIILCFQAFHDIREAYPDAEIALLTMPAYADFTRKMPWFNKVLIDERASGWRFDRWARLLERVYGFGPQKVFDLQGKTRQSVLYALMGGPFGREWSGAAPLCTHPRPWPPVRGSHFTDFIASQLRSADVPEQTPVNLDWLKEDFDHIQLPERFVLFVPGCAPGRTYKRWPAKNYAALAKKLADKGMTCVAVGTKQDADAITTIKSLMPTVLNLAGQTSLHQLATLARRSVAVVGNDTGPTHLAAAVGAPTWALLSDKVNPSWSAPRGPNAHWLQGKPLNNLEVDKVFLALQGTLDRTG